MTGRARTASLLALLFPCLVACTSSCPRETDDTARRYTSGTTSPDRTFYETNAWDGSFVDFPAGRRLALVHGLRETPIDLTSYLAFKGDALPPDGKGFVSESAGNQVLIEGVDEEVIRVRNDTCEDFFLRLVASTLPAADGAGGAASSP
jgi:hypothetical protein